MAQAGRDPRLQERRPHRLEQALLLGAPEPSGIDRDQQVGRAVGAPLLDPDEQLVGVVLDAVDLDPGLPGEVVIEQVVRLVVARGMNVNLGRHGGSAEAVEQVSGKQTASNDQMHGSPLCFTLLC